MLDQLTHLVLRQQLAIRDVRPHPDVYSLGWCPALWWRGTSRTAISLRLESAYGKD